MPIFEYRCKTCGHEFEYLVLGTEPPNCPCCQGGEVDKLMSCCGFVSKSASGQTVSSSASASSCGGCTASSCAGCGH